MKYDKIMSPINYGGIELKNRIIFAPTTLGLREKEYLEKIEEIAKGGVSLIIIGDVPVLESKFGPSLYSKSGFKHYQDITSICHKYDCKVAAQLHQNDTVFKHMFKYIPKLISGKMDKSDLRKVLNDNTGEYISNLSASEVKHITDSFGEAALKAVEAGFDMIEVHGDRMCGSFSSSLFNTRTDEYGGSVLNRTKFAVDSVKSIREKLPNIPIDYKLCVREVEPHYGNAGITVDEIKVFVPILEKAGVTSFHVTLANHGKLEDTIPPINHPYFSSEGCFLKYSDEVRKYTSLPICSVGGFSNPDFILEQLENNRVNCIAMSRQLIADPAWPLKVKMGDVKDINKCRRCNKKCLGGMYEHKGVHCIYEERK